jgi:hypothetical protein
MTPSEIAAWRAHVQRLWGPKWSSPAECFTHLGAVQSQEFHSYRLTPAMRTVPGGAGRDFAPRSAVDALVDAGAVVRTHVLRPTWHTVPVADIRMMLAATADRVLQFFGPATLRSVDLDAATLLRADEALAAATAGGRALTRTETGAALTAAGIADAKGQRLGHMLIHAELTAAVCSGPDRDGKHTWANFDERVPPVSIDREEALRELALRFYTSRGPATLKDFTRWASLTVADAKNALADLTGPDAPLEQITLDGRTCWYAEEPPTSTRGGPVVDFVQGWDEMLCSYTDSREWVLHHSVPRAHFPDRPRYNSAILLDGQVIGNWKATVKSGAVEIETYRYRGFTAEEIVAMRRGADRLRAWFERDEMELVLEHA